MVTNNKKELEWTGERYVPQLRGTIALEHLHRYAYACEFVQGKVVLDIASGEGYGSEMLSRTAAHVYGVDVDKKSVIHAAQKYKKDNLEFILGSCEKIPLPDHSVDLVVSFETIEHTEQHDLVLLEMKRVLKLDGFLIISSPEKADYHEKRNEKNPFHLHELGFEEFQRLLLKHFPQCSFFGQRIISGSQIYKFGEDIHPVAAYELARLPNVTKKSESDLRPTYVLGICGKTATSAACGSFCIQRPWETDYCRELNIQIEEKDARIAGLKQAIASIKNSLIWRLSWPIRLIHFKVDKIIKKNRFKKSKENIYKDENIQEKLINISHYFSSSFQPLEHIPKEKMHAGDQGATDIRAIAIYLPQFHAIPENDEWWGSGFTEWTNVRRATPQYKSHYQPHVPHPDLGYYDLNDASVLEKQAAMACEAGIEGFCFYYYWFNGRRLLNMPTDRLLATGKPDFPFCFCWANENWTRTWDGGDKEILMEQEHSYESDEHFILDLLPAFRDPRYIRVDGKPLLIVYRPALLPDPVATTDHWRETCRREGVGEIFLAFMQGFESPEPSSIGFNTAIQMPPLSCGVPSINSEVELFDPVRFAGEIRDYRSLPHALPRDQIGETLWPAVCPSWDNTPRRMERAHSWIHSSPEVYHGWLSTVVHGIRKTLPAQKRFVFINAWNEWAEGCHLEPDEKYGYAWLNATRLALTYGVQALGAGRRPRVLVVGHDAARAGAQIVLLTMLREWRALGQCDVQLVLLGDGVLRSDFEDVCPTLVLTDYATLKLQNRALEFFCRLIPDVVLANTVVCGDRLPFLKNLGVPIVTYIHELQKSIERWAPGPIMRATVENSNHFIAVSAPVADNLCRNHGILAEKITCVNEYIKTSDSAPPERIEALRAELGIQPHEKIVFGCGTVDWRKGPDLFAQAALEVLKKVPEARFFWIGCDGQDEAASRAHALATDSRICFLGERENSRDYLALGHAFFLSSREDPFPLVALEAADAGLPVVCFADAGGMPEFVGNTCGRTVPFENIDAASEALVEILSNEQLRFSLGDEAQASVRSKHDATLGSAAVLSILKGMVIEPKSNSTGDRRSRSVESEPLVTVIVPNYNHAKFLPERLASIANQSHGNFEIVLLDDKSTDQSLEILRDFSHRDPRARLIPNSVNSGSTFKQWRKGLSQARGKYIWIAESDDSAHPDLVKSLVGKLEARESAIFAACCPVMTDLNGKPHGIPKEWFADIGASLWESDFSIGGLTLLANVMCKKNAILNASGVVFRNSPEVANLVDDSMRLCADWLFWVRLLEKGDFEYIGKPLNLWRQDSSNARTKPAGEVEWNEGSEVIHEAARFLRFDQEGQNQLLQSFSQRCKVWQAKTTQSLPAAALSTPARKIRKLIIHIGAPKTGTSSVQMFLNNYCNEYNRFEFDYFKEFLNSDSEPQHCRFFHAIKWNSNNEIFEKILSKQTDIGILSTELLSFYLNDPSFNTNIRELLCKLEFNGITAEVVGSIREPLSYLLSAYGEDVIGGGCFYSFQDWLFTAQGIGHRNVIKTMCMWKDLPNIQNIQWFLFDSESPANCIDRVINTCLDNKLSIQRINELRGKKHFRKSFDATIIEAIRRINALKIFKWSHYMDTMSAYNYVKSALENLELPATLISQEPNTSQKYELDIIGTNLEESYYLFKQMNFKECSNHEGNRISNEKIEQNLSKLNYNEDLVSFYFNLWNGKI